MAVSGNTVPGVVQLRLGSNDGPALSTSNICIIIISQYLFQKRYQTLSVVIRTYSQLDIKGREYAAL